MVKKFTNIDEICAMVEKSMAETKLPDDLPSTASKPLLEAQLRSGKLVSAIMRYWMEEYNNLGDPMVAAQAITIGVANGIFPFAMEFADIFQGMSFCSREVRMGNTKLASVFHRYKSYAEELMPIGIEREVFDAILETWNGH